ncbi:MAG: type II toxin-antitoxin system HicB family antitoxin [Patescibacteria group bacterium]|nr:type II toxin-antitoxin system HicB family antitoxin [Patescibacteria group bacterium]
MKHQKKTVLDYRVILKPDKRLGSEQSCYVALCPTLGVADDGNTPQEAIANIRSTILFHLECLQKEDKEIPVDNPNEEMVTNTQIPFSLSPLTRLAI